METYRYPVWARIAALAFLIFLCWCCRDGFPQSKSKVVTAYYVFGLAFLFTALTVISLYRLTLTAEGIIVSPIPGVNIHWCWADVSGFVVQPSKRIYLRSNHWSQLNPTRRFIEDWKSELHISHHQLVLEPWTFKQIAESKFLPEHLR